MRARGGNNSPSPIGDCFLVSGAVSAVVSQLFGLVFQLFPIVSGLIVSTLFPAASETMIFQRRSHCKSPSQAIRFAATSSRRNLLNIVVALFSFRLTSIRPRALHSIAQWSR